MKNLITDTASSALILAGDAASRVRNGVARWVPGAVKAIAAGANLVVLRDGSRKVAKAVRRNPVATAAAVTVAVGAGVGLWLLRRNKQRRGLDETMRTIEVEAVRIPRQPPRKRAPRKTAASRSTRGREQTLND
ncbi:MAG TPA: hypothetical protein VK660_03410 [Xanthomonadaceae bacterium]|nr:hypothetical protein [Xanthomonadaceae bacterium]